MSFSKATLAASAFALLSSVSAHGTVSGIIADGKYHTGYSPSFQFYNPEPVVAGWKIPQDLDNGFVAPSKFANPDIICHVRATNPGISIPVTAGSKVQLQWTPWPESHHGPVIDYLASCNGDCTTVDKTTLSFFKIGESGLLDNTNAPGSWASDALIANNNTWVATIPADIAPGNYVLRHEIIALHSSGTLDGAQNYPQCINLIVSGSGTAKPAGTLGTKLYTETDPGILISIYQKLASYVIPGPALYTSGSSPAPATSSSDAAVPTTAAPAPTTAAPAPSSAAPSSVDEAKGTVTATVTRVVTAGGPTVTPACSAVTVTVTAAGATVTKAGSTVTVRAAEVTVTASAKSTGTATLEDVMGWFRSEVKKVVDEGSTVVRRRHARAIAF